MWAQVLRASGPPPAGATWISVSDSASDVFGFLREATGLGWHCLLRLCQDRAIRQAEGTPARLSRWVRALPAQAEQTIELRGRDGVPKRPVLLQADRGARAALCAAERAGARQGAGFGRGPALLGGRPGVAPLEHPAPPRRRDGPTVRPVVQLAVAH